MAKKERRLKSIKKGAKKTLFISKKPKISKTLSYPTKVIKNVTKLPESKPLVFEKTTKTDEMKKEALVPAKIEDRKLTNEENKVEAKSSNPKTKIVFKTHFDTLVDWVDRDKRVTLKAVINRFGITKEVAQEWGEILSENKLLEFHIPAFGEPEFRKKGIVIKDEKVMNKLNRKEVIIFLFIALGLIILLIGFTLSQRETGNDSESPKATGTQKDSKTEEPKSATGIKLAFSGIGSYDCRSKDGSIRYAIKDTLLKIEALDGSSKVVIKDKKTYTLNTKTNEWTESDTRKDLAVPGSGVYPKTSLNCKEVEIDSSEFNT